MFNQKPKPSSSPLERNDHPELDALEEVADVIMQYQSMIGALQWTISLGRFDICTAIMLLLHFHIAPKQGQIDWIKHVYGYIARNPDGIIHVRTNEPDYYDIQDIEYDWECSVYSTVSELVPDDAPPLLGKPVITTTYMATSCPSPLAWKRLQILAPTTQSRQMTSKTPHHWHLLILHPSSNTSKWPSSTVRNPVTLH